MIPTPAEGAKAWGDAFKSTQSKEKYKRSIGKLSVSPTEQAAAKAEQYANAVREAVDSGRFQDSLRAVSLDDYKAAAMAGVDNFDKGVKKGQSKQQRFNAEYYPVLEQVRLQVKSMPNATEAERDARYKANADALRAFGKSRRRSKY